MLCLSKFKIRLEFFVFGKSSFRFNLGRYSVSDGLIETEKYVLDEWRTFGSHLPHDQPVFFSLSPEEVLVKYKDKNWNYGVHWSTTVKDLKKQICEKEGLFIEQMDLTHSNRLLPDDVSLHDADIFHGGWPTLLLKG